MSYPVPTNIRDVDFTELMTRILGLLTAKEKDIIERRFAIKAPKKETLDRIGRSYSITRERVRQIEAVAIQKLARISQDPAMQLVHNLAIAVLKDHGGAMVEEKLIEAMIKLMGAEKELNPNSLKFALRVSRHLNKQDKNQFYRAFWFTEEYRLQDLRELMREITDILDSERKIMSFEEVYERLEGEYNEEAVKSVMYVDWNFMVLKDGRYGLKSWRFLNPRSIKDCIIILLKKSKKPMHFRDILSALLTEFPKRKRVTLQACHNELIRHEDFVLLGRGTYGLKEWNMSAGTVCDLIVSVFKENNFEPMRRKDIIEKVLKRREVRLGTISLNLQKYPFFRRVGRAVYEYVSSLDDRKRTKYSNLA